MRVQDDDVVALECLYGIDHLLVGILASAGTIGGHLILEEVLPQGVGTGDYVYALILSSSYVRFHIERLPVHGHSQAGVDSLGNVALTVSINHKNLLAASFGEEVSKLCCSGSLANPSFVISDAKNMSSLCLLQFIDHCHSTFL